MPILENAQRIIITACGTSWHAGLVGEYMLEQYGKIPVEVEYASEFRYRNPIIKKGDVVFLISQSGETADTLAALREAKQKGAAVFGICNVVGSTIARESQGESISMRVRKSAWHRRKRLHRNSLCSHSSRLWSPVSEGSPKPREGRSARPFSTFPKSRIDPPGYQQIEHRGRIERQRQCFVSRKG